MTISEMVQIVFEKTEYPAHLTPAMLDCNKGCIDNVITDAISKMYYNMLGKYRNFEPWQVWEMAVSEYRQYHFQEWEGNESP